MDETKKRELEEKYGAIEIVATEKGEAAFKRLDRRQRNEYLTMLQQDKIGQAADFACLATVVVPDRNTFDSWIDENPALSLICVRKHLTSFNRLGAELEGKG